MKLADLIQTVQGSLLTPKNMPDLDVRCAACSDLMSDVLAFATPRAVLLTGLVHPQVIRTAEMAEISAIVFVRGKSPDPQTVAMGEEHGIPLVSSPLPMFTICGRLYEKGLAGCETTCGL